MTAPISSIPTTRVSDQLVRQRLLSQVQFDQNELYRLQNEVSTGQRLILPSDDPNAALRGVAIQNLINRKDQIKVNLTSSQGQLNAADAALGNISSVLNDIKSLALSSVGANASNAQRATAATQVDNAISQLLQTANQTVQGRRLFGGGSVADAPFQKSGSLVAYKGNTQSLLTYSDLDALFANNVDGDQAFGAITTPVVGVPQLSPALTESTRLADLNGGQGISRGSVAVSDGTNSSIVRLDGAATLGDVARLLEKYPPGWDANPPSGRTLTARVTSTGLTLQLSGGNLSVSEVAGGTTAGELGIKHLPLGSAGPLVGATVARRLTVTTPLSDLLGARSTAYVASSAINNDLVFEAAANGTTYNGTKIQFLDDDRFQAGPGVTAGNETATFSASATPAIASLALPGIDNDLILTATTAGTAYNDVSIDVVAQAGIGNSPTASYSAGPPKRLTLTIDNAGGTTLGALVTAINAEGHFQATPDPTAGEAYVAGGAVSATAAGTNRGNTFNSGGAANTLFVHIQSGSTTANQVVAAVNAAGLPFVARLDLAEANNGSGAIYDSSTNPLATGTASGGSGKVIDLTSGLRINSAGVAYTVDLSAAKNVGDVLNAINSAGANVLAEINATGNGINLRSVLSGADFSVGENGGTTAADLGVRSLTAATTLGDLNHGLGVFKTGGTDFVVRRQDGVQLNVNLTSGIAASARLPATSTGAHNGLLFSRIQAGVAGNSFQVAITDSGPGGGNAVSLAGNTLSFNVDIGAGFTAQSAINLLHADPTLSAQFDAQLDKSTDAANDGSGNLAVSAPLNFSNGQGQALTVGDVLSLINNDPVNLAAAAPVTARLATVGNGIELTNTDASGTTSLQISGGTTTRTAIDLGLIPQGSATSGTPTIAGATQTLSGSDVNPIEVHGVFSALLRLREALTANDTNAIGRATDLLDEASSHVVSTRSDVGLRLQTADALQSQLVQQQSDLKSALSQEIDADLTTVISDLVGKQTAYQASLRVSGSISQLTLLNFI